MATTKEFIIETKRPKAFSMPTISMISAREPNERYVLWIIANCPYAFNPLYTGQFLLKSASLAEEDSNFNKAYKILDSLYVQNLIKRDKSGNYHVTLLGYIHRVRTHTAFTPLQTIFAALVAISIAISVFQCNHSASNKPQPTQEQPQSNSPKTSAAAAPLH